MSDAPSARSSLHGASDATLPDRMSDRLGDGFTPPLDFLRALFGGRSAADAALGGPTLKTERLILRPPRRNDYADWAELRRRSQLHLTPWEPRWAADHLRSGAFRRRVAWSRREIAAGRAYPFLVFAREPSGRRLIGGVTLEHVRRGAAQSASLGYWLGESMTGRGYMTEALHAVIAFASHDLDLSRLEAACLPHNFRSRRLLERVGFRQEGLARGYLQIDGAWRDHILYERRRGDRLERSVAAGDDDAPTEPERDRADLRADLREGRRAAG